MSIAVRAWQSDGPNGESELRTIWIKKISTEAIPAMELLRELPKCVRVSLDITGNMRNGKPRPFKTLWSKPGYRDPFGNDGKMVLKRVFIPD